MTAALLVVLKACVAALICAIGLGSTPADLAYLLSAAVVTIPYLKWRARPGFAGSVQPGS